MKALKPLIVILVILIICTFLLPTDIRDGYYFYLCGRAAELTGNSISALSAYKTASDSMPDNAVFARARARTLNDIAEDTEDDGYYQEAYNFTNGWIDENITHMELWQMYVEKARAEWGLGRKATARISIDEAVRLMPVDYTALIYQGIIYRDIRPLDHNSVRLSIPIFQHAIEIRRRTRTSWAHLELAKAYWMIQDDARALNQIQQTLSEFPPREIKREAERLKIEIQSSGRVR